MQHRVRTIAMLVARHLRMPILPSSSTLHDCPASTSVMSKKPTTTAVNRLRFHRLILASPDSSDGLRPQFIKRGLGKLDHGRSPEPLNFFIWTVEDVRLWLEEIKLGSYRQIFGDIGVNGEYLESMSRFTTEQILRFIRLCHMKWGDFITLCKELRRIKVACLKGEQQVRGPWWAPSCLSIVCVKVAKRNRRSRVVSLKLEP